MRPRVSEDALEALLHEGDPAPALNPVSETERVALLARLSEGDCVGAAPRRRRSGAPAVGFMLVSALSLAIFWPRESPHVVSSPVSPSPSPASSTSSSGFKSASSDHKAPMSDFIASSSAHKLSSSDFVASSSVSHTSSSVRNPSSPSPQRQREAHEAHLVIVADDTCTVETPVPVTEHVTIMGDETSVVAVTESIAPTSNEKTREVSL
ncbi:hypothetical protein HNQ39_002022 [Armatimonas rosea]|uniref:Uncharacterized protein n=1 Tax=Armatimonas rosea TaxID=685828 RepID=A0A7W9SP81_ARMRO|nr:hypothetical protein [Armatimonas rosea]